MADDKINRTMRVTVKQVVNGGVVPDRVFECVHASVNPAGDTGNNAVTVDFAGSPPDQDGWTLIWATFTDVVLVTREVKADE